MEQFAPVVRRRTPTFPMRWANYFDLRAWGGGFLRCNGVPGAVVLRDDLLVDLISGRVYRDERFSKGE